MNLDDLIRAAGMTRRQLAEALGVDDSMIRHWVTGRSAITAERAVAIERASAGRISRAVLRPDLWGLPG